METMIRPQVGMRFRTKKKKEAKEKKEKGQQKKWPTKMREGPNKKMREKREGTMLLSFLPHLCFKVAP